MFGTGLEKINAVVIGTSAGGLKALKSIVEALPADFDLPVFIVQHLNPQSGGFLPSYLSQFTQLRVKEAEPNETVVNGTVYIAPANYHLLIEKDKKLSLTVDEKVNFSRPSIDILFESAAEVYLEQLLGILLTGANNDGSKGIIRIHQLGGITIAQHPASAEVKAMPQSAIETGAVNWVLHLDEITLFLAKLSAKKNQSGEQIST
ncbi:chemotaxis protein CheB [Bacteroidales bacterium]